MREAAKRVEIHFAGLSLRGHQRRSRDVIAARQDLAEFCRSVTILSARGRSSKLGKVWSAARALATGRSYNEAWLDYRRSRSMVQSVVERVRPDLIHVDSIMIANLLPAAYRGAAVLNHHNVESHMMARRVAGAKGLIRAFMAREAKLLERLERRFAGRFDRHVVVSELDGLRLAEVAPDLRWEDVPNGVDIEYFRPMTVTEQPATLVFCGRMNWYPNEEAMCRFVRELWPQVRKQRPDTRLVIVGMNPTSKLRAVAAGDDSVTIVGFVEDVRPAIAAASLYVCPILDGGGTRLKLLDAMALGKAIVATPLAVEGLEVADGRDVVVREFGAPFVDAIVGLLADSGRRAELAREARQTAVARYAWKDLGARLVAVYETALAESSAGGRIWGDR